MLNAVPAICPYCGESIDLLVDGSAGAQAYVEDCAVCCRPMLVEVLEDGSRVRLRRDDEA